MYIKECLLSDWTDTTLNKTSVSFYDSFSFVDRLTSKKLNFKDARKYSGFLLPSSKKNIYLNKRKSQKSTQTMKQNFSIYKKTKQFQLKALKQKIFKKSGDNQDDQIVSPKQMRYSIKYKKKIRDLIDSSVQSLNKKQFRKISQKTQSEHLNVNRNIIDINNELKRTKTSLNMRKINQILKFQEDYDNKNKEDQFKLKDEFTILQKQEQKQNKIEFKNKECKKFFDKMMIHAKNQIMNRGQFLIAPSKQKQKNDILLRKTKKLYAFSNLKKQNDNDFSDIEKHSFQKLKQTQLINKIKNENRTKNRSSTQINQADQIYQDMIIKLVKQNYIGNLNIQLEVNSKALWSKDAKNNNLIHLCIKYRNYEALNLIFKKVQKKKLMKLLDEKNSFKKTPKRLAQILIDKTAIEIFQSFQKQIKNTYFFD